MILFIMKKKEGHYMRKTVLISGASSGLGKQFARIFAHEQYDLVLVARNKEKLMALKKQIEGKYQVHAEVIICDLAQTHAAEDIYDVLCNQNITIDVLINNAGFGDYGEFISSDLKRQKDMIMVNILSLVSLTHLLLPSMRQRKSGKILNVSSMAAFQSGPLMSVYYASKAFVLSFSEALHEELKHSGIHVCALCPGPTQTEFFHNANLQTSSSFYEKHISDPKKIAIEGYFQLMHNKAVNIPGLSNKMITAASKMAPRWLSRQAVTWLQKEKTGSHQSCPQQYNYNTKKI